MARVVLDPNVLISARISPKGPPAKLLEAAEEGHFELVASRHSMNEVRDVLERPKMRHYLEIEEIQDYLGRVRDASTIFPDPRTTSSLRNLVPSDPRDVYLVALALINRVDIIVSGDSHLKERAPYSESGSKIVRVLTPREFLDELG